MHLLLMGLGATTCTSLGFVAGASWASMHKLVGSDGAMDTAWVEPVRRLPAKPEAARSPAAGVARMRH